MSRLVLSLFPGIGMLDEGFIAEGFCTVRGPDPLWSGDVRKFHPPAGAFDGVIGGPPCQAFSRMAHLTRARGLEPKFGNLIPEFERCVAEARPSWFLMENVEAAPEPVVDDYGVTSFILKNQWLGEAQRRTRRFSFGMRFTGAPNLMQWIPGVAFEHAGDVNAVCGDRRNSFIPRGQAEVDAIKAGEVKAVERADDKQPKRTLGDMLELQGFPPDWLDEQPWTTSAKRKMVGNGVPLAMGRAVAKAIREATR